MSPASMRAKAPVVREFTKAILRIYNPSIGNVGKKDRINSDLVPKVRGHKMESSIVHEPKKVLHPVAHKPLQYTPRPKPNPHPAILTSDYGKLNVLLKDDSVSSIECPGAGKQIIVINMGQRQFTQIVLTEEEIKNFLGMIADKAHVPLIEGVFRAAVDNFVVHAVVSEMVGNRFVIKKQTPYSLLEMENRIVSPQQNNIPINNSETRVNKTPMGNVSSQAPSTPQKLKVPLKTRINPTSQKGNNLPSPPKVQEELPSPPKFDGNLPSPPTNNGEEVHKKKSAEESKKEDLKKNQTPVDKSGMQASVMG